MKTHLDILRAALGALDSCGFYATKAGALGEELTISAALSDLRDPIKTMEAGGDIQRQARVMKEILSLISSGAIQGDNCRAIASTTLNELYLKPAPVSDGGEG